MHVQALKLSKRLTDLLLAAQLETVEQVQQAGRDGLIAIDGIGPASADEILAAAARMSAPPDGDTASPKNEPSGAPPQPPSVNETSQNANGRVTVRNASSVPVLVNGKYMFPGDVQTIRRHQMKAGLVVQGLGA